MSAMTLERLRDWHLRRETTFRRLGAPDTADEHRAAADAIAAHLTQPAQVVDVARRFHETYERLAPSFGYETRPDTRAFDPKSPNGKLMTAVCAELARALSTAQADGWISVKDRLPERNKPAIYWHTSEFGGFVAIADEWRDEHHLQYASHWMPYTPPQPEE